MPEGLSGSLQSALADLAKWFDAAGIPAMIIGGVAASVLGRPRLRQDVDALAILPLENWKEAIEVAATCGIVPRIDNALEFAERSRVLLMRHAASGIDLDITFGGLPFEQSAVAQSGRESVRSASVARRRILGVRAAAVLRQKRSWLRVTDR